MNALLNTSYSSARFILAWACALAIASIASTASYAQKPKNSAKSTKNARILQLSPGADFQKKLSSAVKAINADKAHVLHFAPGTYAIPTTLKFQKRMGQDGLRITGAGVGITKLVFTNIDTAISVTLDSDIRQPSKSPSFCLEDLSLVASGRCGTAVDFRKGDSDMKGGIEQKIFSNLSIDIDKGSWKTGINVTDLTFCTFKDITIRPPGKDSIGIHITGDEAPVDHHLSRIRILGCDTGIKVSGNVEGVYISQATIIGINVGIDWDTTGHEPLLSFSGSHISARKTCVRANNLLQPVITGNLLYQAGHEHEWTGIDIRTERQTGYDLLQISNNILHGSPKHEKPNTGISINAASAGVVNANIFSAVDTGIHLGKLASDIKPTNNVFKATGENLQRTTK